MSRMVIPRNTGVALAFVGGTYPSVDQRHIQGRLHADSRDALVQDIADDATPPSRALHPNALWWTATVRDQKNEWAKRGWWAHSMSLRI